MPDALASSGASLIFVDSRAGSKDLIAPLRAKSIDTEESYLEFGDLFWAGRGEKGAPVLVGVEFKKLEELVGALRTERLQGHQMLGMPYYYDYSYLFIEGEVLYDRKGRLQQRKGRFNQQLELMPGNMTVGELFKRVNVLHLRGGLNPWWSVTRADTIQSIIGLYRTWTDQDLDKHKSHLAIYVPPMIIPVSDMRRTLSTFPGIGRHLSLAVETHFEGSLERATAAPIEEWAEIVLKDEKGKTRRLGRKLAAEIVAFCKGDEYGC